MTLPDVLKEILQRLGPDGDTVLAWEQVRRWPKGAIEALQEAGWVAPIAGATMVECSGCEEILGRRALAKIVHSIAWLSSWKALKRDVKTLLWTPILRGSTERRSYNTKRLLYSEDLIDASIVAPILISSHLYIYI